MSNHPQQTEAWARGDAYEPYVGRWSRLVAREFLGWLAVPARNRWLDLGCGTGALTAAILAQADPDVAVGLDASAGYVRFARSRVNDPRARFVVGDAGNLPFAADSVGATVSGLVLNFMPDPQAMVGEMVRVTASGGTVAVYVWDYAGEMQMMRVFWDAAKRLDPHAADLDEGRRFPLCRPQPLRELFTTIGLAGVDVRSIGITTIFRDFDDYWTPFLGGQGPAPGYVQSLSREQMAELRELLRTRLPVSSDGSIYLRARAWAVRGTR